MEIPTVRWEKGEVVIIDQTLLPSREEYLRIADKERMREAIYSLRVRGAPAIGIAAALAAAAEMSRFEAADRESFLERLDEVAGYLAASRPTAVNLAWALERLKGRARLEPEASVEDLKEALVAEALAILEEDRSMCRAIGEAGAELIGDGAGVLTHCNAGGLATSGYGTALAPIYTAWEQGKRFRVFADETRPLLQGARLTVWELMKAGVDVTLLCDNAAAALMKKGLISLVITGADRVAANGDAANKIGTYGVAVLAREHGIPFYMAWPVSTLDLSLPSGDQIPIEERDGGEVAVIAGNRISPAGAKSANPAFDVTPHELISAFITDRGLVYPPYRENLEKIFAPGAEKD